MWLLCVEYLAKIPFIYEEQSVVTYFIEVGMNNFSNVALACNRYHCIDE